MALEPRQAVRLARTLRELRESEWPGEELTQAQLATAFSTESKVGPATLSSWESTTNPKAPTAIRLTAYARFFATRRSLEGTPHLVPEKELTPAEQARFEELEEQLLGLLHADVSTRRSTFSFESGPVTVICPETPVGEQGPLARGNDPNFAKAQRYADLDAMIEIFGHLRAANPELDVFYRLASEVVADDFSAHVILLGGIAWNKVTRRFQRAIKAEVPIEQITDPAVETGEIFMVDERKYLPVWDDPADRDPGDEPELIEDVAFLARLTNPFQTSRTLTICNGIHSRGVLGAVRCLTDKRVRDRNESYLADRFPDGRFAMLLRVPVVSNESLSPDLHSENARLFEWSPESKDRSR